MTDHRRYRILALQPLANVDCVESDAGRLECMPSTDDPQLEMVLDEGAISSGYWLMEFSLKRQGGGSGTSRLYPDYGQGMAEVTSIELSAGSATEVAQVVHFPKDVVALRFDPHEGRAKFSVGKVTLRRLMPKEALWLASRQPLYALSKACVGDAASLANELVKWQSSAGAACAWEHLNKTLMNRDRVVSEASYEAWIANCEQVPVIEEDRWNSVEAPLISVLMPTYNTELRWLRKAVDSVIGQSYPHWELCIADDASSSAELVAFLSDIAARDKRIRVSFRSENGHISKASNTALEMVQGRYVALLDHDDELNPHALHFVAECIAENQDAVLIYSDEDKIDGEERRFDPYFKPDWNPDLLLGQNFISHLGVYRTDVVRKVGGFRAGLEGSQDYDLALRVVEAEKGRGIIHIPRVLYHWRAIEGSTALATSEKDYAVVAAEKAVREHLERIRAEGSLVSFESSGLRVRRPVPVPSPLVSLVVPTRDKVDLLKVCVSSILEKSTYKNFEILVVDNGSVESETLSYFGEIAENDRVRVLEWDKPFNYSEINNFAVSESRGNLIGLINNDIEVITEDWLEEMVSHAVRPEVGAVGCKLFYPDGKIQHAGVVLGVHGVAAHQYCGLAGDYPGQMNRANLIQGMSAVTGACLLVRKESFMAVGGLDPALAVAFNDVDLCLKLRKKGLQNVWTPFARLYHHESASRGKEDSAEKQQRFRKEVELMRSRWSDILDNDPCYNQNLTRTGIPFTLTVEEG